MMSKKMWAMVVILTLLMVYINISNHTTCKIPPNFSTIWPVEVEHQHFTAQIEMRYFESLSKNVSVVFVYPDPCPHEVQNIIQNKDGLFEGWVDGKQTIFTENSVYFLTEQGLIRKDYQVLGIENIFSDFDHYKKDSAKFEPILTESIRKVFDIKASDIQD